jgi:hypothetical protein
VGAVTSIPSSVNIKSSKVKQQLENIGIVILPHSREGDANGG